MKLGTVTQSSRLAPAHCGRPPRRVFAAFTLLEVLVAVVVAAIIFTGVISAVNTGNIIIQGTRENLRATQIMESRMEGLRLIAWGTATNQLFNPLCVPTNFVEKFYPLGLSGVTNNQGVVYYGTMTLQTNISLTPPSSYSTQMCLVTVTVKWTNSHYGIFNAHTRTMSTFVAQYGLQNYVYYATNN